MAYGKIKMGKKLNSTTEPGDDKRRYIDDPPYTEKGPYKNRTTAIPKPAKPSPKPINKPGVKPPKRKTGPRPSNRNDIIRNRLRPAGSN